MQFGTNLPRLSACPEIKEGTLFPNFDVAVHYCVEYGRFKGFTVRKKRMDKNTDGSIRSRCLDCEYSGKAPNNDRVTARNKGTKKTQCQWHINLSQPISASCVKVNTFVDEHNHTLLPDTEIFSTEFRTLPDEMKNDIEYFVSCGVSDLHTIRSLVSPKYDLQYIHSQDMLNFIQKVKRQSADTSNDSAKLLEYLLAKQHDDSLFIVIPRIDMNSLRLTGIFWMSSEQQLLYSKYHDVILHDNTALTNKYKWPLSLFLAVDCNNKSRLLAQAFIQDETEESYIWLLKCFKRTNIEPKTIITDADPAMLSALQQELPNTFHVTCIYHLSQNLPKRLKSILGKDYLQFLNDFYIARNSVSEDVFEYRWERLQDKYSQAKNYLTNTLYKTKESWAYCYTLKVFTGGMQSTQRVEGLNAIIHKEVESSMSLTMACEKILKRLEVENMTQR